MTSLEAPQRRVTRAAGASDLPAFDTGALDPAAREALAELLLTMADDEFVLGFWDSEWTGIAPVLEEDVAFSSLAQDELGHARVLYEMLAQLSGDDADRIAFGRPPEAYRHARLLDHARGDWAFSICRRWLYDTADATRLTALRTSSFAPLAQVVAKIRREETYHLMHMDVWMRRLASADDPRRRLMAALDALWADALSPLAPLANERTLLDSGILSRPMHELASEHRDRVESALVSFGLPIPQSTPTAEAGRDRADVSEAFRWLWGEFTMVHRLEESATW